ncbi:MAG: energy-coupling factor ABC transporter permease [Sulfuricella sp.]|nr:energy-coupling factor ABC transporter permease [Sulfuricella sp.]
MNLPDNLLPAAWCWAGHFLFALVLGWAVLTAPWARLRDEAQQHLWLGACVALMALWSIKTGIRPGLNFHLLGATVATLMFGPQLAVIAIAVVLAGITVAGESGWQAYSLNALVMGVTPIALSYGLFRLIEAKLPNNFFIYVFANAFLGGGLAMVSTGAVSALLLFFSGVYTLAYMNEHYLPYFILLAWSEAVTSGAALTLMVVYSPEWVATFDDARYIRNK